MGAMQRGEFKMMDNIKEQIEKLKKEKNAIILAHYYQTLDVQDVADHVGDSYALAKLAQEAQCDKIILCGVRFMAESAKILNPDKEVYLPAESAGCPMADMITAEDVIELKKEYPEAAVVCYVNSSAEVKAECDVCCTSSSAGRIVNSLSEKQVIFVPDKNLGAYIAKSAPDKEVILFDGFCPTHDAVTGEMAKKAREENPNAKIAVHPECRPEVLEYADYVGSTAGILEYVRKTDCDEFVIGTEIGVVEILQREFPSKKISLIQPRFTCVNMKKTTIIDVLRCLEGEKAPIKLPEKEMLGARRSLERMVSL